MIVSIGTRSDSKITSITTAFSNYPELWKEEGNIEYMLISEEIRKEGAKGNQCDGLSGVSCIPTGMEEMILGAKNRAFHAYTYAKNVRGSCGFGIGIESGCFEVKQLQTNYLNTSICAIYNGVEYGIGMGPGLEAPKCVMDRTLAGEEQGEMKDIFGEQVRGRNGMIWTLSNERLHRCDIEQYAVMTALTRFLLPKLYKEE